MTPTNPRFIAGFLVALVVTLIVLGCGYYAGRMDGERWGLNRCTELRREP